MGQPSVDASGRVVGKAESVIASGTSSVAVTKSDTTPLRFKALFIGTGGTVVIRHVEGGPDATFTNVQDGSILPVSGVRVMNATTASGIVAMEW